MHSCRQILLRGILPGLLLCSAGLAQEAPPASGPPVAIPVPVAVAPAAPAAAAAEPASVPGAANIPAVATPARVFIPPLAPKPEIYQKLSDPSPFTNRPSEPTGGDVAQPADLSLIGLMTLDGKTNVWVQPKDSEEPVQLVEGDARPNEAGLKLIRVVSPNDMYKAVAEIEAGGQIRQVRFTEASLSLAPGAGAPKGGGQGGANKSGGGGPPIPGQTQAGSAGQGQPTSPNEAPGLSGRPPGGARTPPAVTPRRRIILPK